MESFLYSVCFRNDGDQDHPSHSALSPPHCCCCPANQKCDLNAESASVLFSLLKKVCKMLSNQNDLETQQEERTEKTLSSQLTTWRLKRSSLTFHLITTLAALNEVNKKMEDALLTPLSAQQTMEDALLTPLSAQQGTYFILHYFLCLL